MSKGYVKVLANATVKETVASMIEVNQKCALVVDDNDLLEGIFTLDDLQREVFRAMKEASHEEQVMFEVSYPFALVRSCSGIEVEELSRLNVCLVIIGRFNISCVYMHRQRGWWG